MSYVGLVAHMEEMRSVYKMLARNIWCEETTLKA